MISYLLMSSFHPGNIPSADNNDGPLPPLPSAPLAAYVHDAREQAGEIHRQLGIGGRPEFCKQTFSELELSLAAANAYTGEGSYLLPNNLEMRPESLQALAHLLRTEGKNFCEPLARVYAICLSHALSGDLDYAALKPADSLLRFVSSRGDRLQFSSPFLCDTFSIKTDGEKRLVVHATMHTIPSLTTFANATDTEFVLYSDNPFVSSVIKRLLPDLEAPNIIFPERARLLKYLYTRRACAVLDASLSCNGEHGIGIAGHRAAVFLSSGGHFLGMMPHETQEQQKLMRVLSEPLAQGGFGISRSIRTHALKELNCEILPFDVLQVPTHEIKEKLAAVSRGAEKPLGAVVIAAKEIEPPNYSI